jgi:hypothetical protein
MKAWWTIGLGVWGFATLAGCRGASHDVGDTLPEECMGAHDCECPGGGPSQSRCEEDGSEVCDCVCSDFEPTPTNDDFEICSGSANGAWELTSVDPSPIAGKDIVHNCRDVQVAEGQPLHWLMILGDEAEAQVSRSTELLDLQMLASCADPQHTCERLSGSWDKNECGACQAQLELGGIEDDNASWHTSGGHLRISYPLFRDNGSVRMDDYEYCVKDNTLTLRSYLLGVTYTLERRYVTGTRDACLARSLDACEELDGCHEGRCAGYAECALWATRDECDEHACTWSAELCGGIHTKLCAVADYGVDPGCTVSESAP